ncbi:MAG: serine/threonine protein kinase [Gemmataceae bacterium]|nr:serine/threonine protein kinase [Gemmataceae bacterium]
MTPTSPPGGSTECPSRADLAAFLKGDVVADRLLHLGDHLISCSDCRSTLQGLESEGAAPPDWTPLAPPSADQPPRVPGRLGPYRMLRRLGGGGMGVVFEALHLRLGRRVALKTLPPTVFNHPDARARFNREVTALGCLDHRNVVYATDAGEAHGFLYLAMDLVDGLDLNRLVRLCGPLPVADACELCRQAAEGLQYIHEQGRVHRDVKPSNLMVTPRGEVKVLDLGLALLHEGPGRLTASGQFLGTADFAAPEQGLSARRVDIRADIYSLGCTLYKLLTAAPPFGGPEYDSTLKKLAAHANTAVPSIRQARPDVPEELEALLLRLLAKDAEDRPATPGEVAAALAPFTAGSDLPALVERGRLAQARPLTDSQVPTAPHGKVLRPLPGDRLAAGGPGRADRLSPGITPRIPGEYEPTPAPETTPRPQRSRRSRSRAVLLLSALATVVLATAALAWLAGLTEGPGPAHSAPPTKAGQPAPEEYPSVLRDRPRGQPVDLIARKPFAEFAGRKPFPGQGTADFDRKLPQNEKGYHVTWCRRLLGQGRFGQTPSDLWLGSSMKSVGGVLKGDLTVFALDDDPHRRWFELNVEIRHIEQFQPHQLPNRYGVFFGWHAVSPDKARAYFVYLERPGAANAVAAAGRVLVADVSVPTGPDKREHPGFLLPLKEFPDQKLMATIAVLPWDPVRQTWHHIRVRAESAEEVVVQVDNARQQVRFRPAFNPRGPLGVWVQDGQAGFGEVTITALSDKIIP